MEILKETAEHEKFVLTITADSLTSTDPNFDENDDLSMIFVFKPLDVYFQGVNGEKVEFYVGEKKKKTSNKTLPRLACKIFGHQLVRLSKEEKENFPICRCKSDSDVIRGIYDSQEGFEKITGKKIGSVNVKFELGHFVFYSWGIFSTVTFVQECLKRFGKPGEKFVLIYREKNDEDDVSAETEIESEAEETVSRPVEYKNSYPQTLLVSKNLIFHGAPGTGKTFLAKKIAADIISGGETDDFTSLSDEQKKQVEFVQFHPSYDYTDFVEGLRPRLNDDGSMGFELQDGIFKKFAARARKNFEDAHKPVEMIETELSVQEAMENFFEQVESGKNTFETLTGNPFTITNWDDGHIYISIPGNDKVNTLALNLDEVRKMLESGIKFEKVKDLTNFFGKKFATQHFSYDFVIYKEIKARMRKVSQKESRPEEKKYVFIIDEINRGEISKIFGELFFSVDPGYRGRAGEISTQYANLHADPSEKFYVPENVYIIGTMNDIDRSVDSFDFAMRRRFRFINIKAEDTAGMLDGLADGVKSEARRRMKALNAEIAKTEDLNENYQIGASYFLKVGTVGFDKLWTDWLAPLLAEYVQGMYDEKGIMKRFADAYGYAETPETADETASNQG